MKTSGTVKLFAASLVLLAGAGTARAGYVATGGSAAHLLLVRPYTLAAGESITISTLNCSDTSDDTVMFLLEGAAGASTRTTAAWNDDTALPDDPFCSTINFTNTSGASKSYEAVVTVYPETAAASVTYRVWRSSTGMTTNENLTIGGSAQIFNDTGNVTHDTMGLRPSVGGGPVDTILYVMDRNTGATSYFDDDSGPRLLSRINATMPCGAWNCWSVAGRRTTGGSGLFEFWGRTMTGPDSDFDQISDEVEDIKGTNKLVVDTDLDGLTDYQEFFGIFASPITGADNSLILAWQDTGADPKTPDMFIEVDYMAQTTAPAHSHNPSAAGNWTSFLADLTATFKDDMAFTGKAVVPHVMISDSIPETPYITFGNCIANDTTRFYTIKQSSAYFDPLRATVFRYVIMGHSHKFMNCTIDGFSGEAEIFGNDIMVTLGGFTGGTGTPADQHGTFVHELGHNVGLAHFNNGNNSGANSCVHSSVMNYRYQTSGWGDASIPAARRFGYSNGQCPASGHGCANTCNANHCVPAGQTSPKNGCTPNSSGTCDCDRGEWTLVNLDIPSNSGLVHTDCGVTVCTGAGPDEQILRTFVLGDVARWDSRHRDLARARRLKLESLGMLEGRDFVVHPSSGRLYAKE